MSDVTPPAVGGPAGPPTTPTVVIYGRNGCHLCEDALVVIQNTQRRISFALEQVDIESDEALFKRYLERIPVVTINGREFFELFVDESKLVAALRGQRGHQRHSK